MDKVDITIIGAGVVGLAVAEKLSVKGNEVAVVEKNESFGQETSSRNSEVIHSGIYYRKGSLKLKLCLEGNRKLYDICLKNKVPFEKTGKLIAAFSKEDVEQLEKLFSNGRSGGVEGLELLSAAEARKLEPNLDCRCAILCKSTGIVDSHSLMKYFKQKAEERGAVISFKSEVTGIEKTPAGFLLTVEEPGGVPYRFESAAVVNSAGLNADKIAAMAGIDVKRAGYSQLYCKGEYFHVNDAYRKVFNKLIYPVPGAMGLGIHTVKDIRGSLRLGPNEFMVGGIDYSVDASHSEEFFIAAKNYFPGIRAEELMPDLSGIRPQVEPAAGGFRDFIIKEETAHGLPGFINLIGIESPGLTSAPAIADFVENFIHLTLTTNKYYDII